MVWNACARFWGRCNARATLMQAPPSRRAGFLAHASQDKVPALLALISKRISELFSAA